MEFKIELGTIKARNKEEVLDNLFEVMEDWVLHNQQPDFLITEVKR